MQQEIEAKFLNQNHDEIRTKLQAFGAVCEHKSRLMRRTVFDYPDRRLQSRGAWVRLREELNGDVEVVLKQNSTSSSINGVFESTLKVQDYDTAEQFLLAIGLEIKGRQESKREVWRLNKTEIMLDEWPWVPPFIEIESDSEQKVKDIVKMLGLEWGKARFGAVTPVYTEHFGITDDYFVSLELSMRFADPIPQELTKYIKL